MIRWSLSRLAGAWWLALAIMLLVAGSPVSAQTVGETVSVLGKAEVMRDGRWQELNPGGMLEAGEVVQTGDGSRLAIQLADGPQIKLNANSRLELKDKGGIAPVSTSVVQIILRLIKGEIHGKTDRGSLLEIRTMPATAIIRGTEFNLAVDRPDSARLAVLEGLVEFANPQGSVRVAAGEQATAKVGEAPRKTVLLNPLDAVQWSLYYPELPGDVTAPAGRADSRSPRHWTRIAQNHLLRGEVPEARRALDRALALSPDDARAHSLRAVIALVQNRKAEARADAERAVAADPAAPEAHLALSWVQQAEFDLDGALASARRAVELDPDDPQALIQESRLLFGMDRTKEATKVAEKARQRAPKDALVGSTWGFLQLARGRVKEADQAFREAISQDSTLGEPHLGLGLALFRRNQTEAAVEEMRKATLLEPKVSLYNSYLGKAYYETKDDRLAQKYLAEAKQLDPRDPTPHFYDAIRLQSINRPVEAVQDLQTSIELNDNRAMYRSRLLLDEDLAARDTALGKIYNQIGFEQLGLNEVWKSLAHDPANYSAHRLLADSYSTMPRHEIARASELLQSQLLQSINTNPVQPQLAETNLFILADVGPTTASLYEYNPLFVRDHLTILASGIIGINSTLGDEVVLSGIEDRFSYSLGQFHYETNGFRENNDLKHDIFNLFAQITMTPNLNLQAELRRRKTEYGDLRLNFDPDDFSSGDRTNVDQDTVRLGAHFSLSPQSDLYVSFIHSNREENKIIFSNALSNVLPDIFPDLFSGPKVNTDVNDLGYQAEAQYLIRSSHYSVIAGIGSYDIETEQHIISSISNQIESKFESNFKRERDNAYIYANINYPSNLIWTLGLSYDAFHEGNYYSDNLNPKLGLLWNINDNTRLRFAAFQAIKPALVVEQTIEQTQVAGFNQFFDDTNGTRSRRYGVGFDARLTKNVYAGIEASRRDIERPILRSEDLKLDYFEDEQEDLYRAYLYWIPHHRWAVRTEYQFERFKRERNENDVDVDAPTRLETTTFPIAVYYFDPSGVFGELETFYVNQDVERTPIARENDSSVTSRLATGEETFVLLNAAIGYRLPKRQGIFSFQAINLLDKKFLFQDVNFQNSEEKTPIFIPERILIARFTINF